MMRPGRILFMTVVFVLFLNHLGEGLNPSYLTDFKSPPWVHERGAYVITFGSCHCGLFNSTEDEIPITSEILPIYFHRTSVFILCTEKGAETCFNMCMNNFTEIQQGACKQYGHLRATELHVYHKFCGAYEWSYTGFPFTKLCCHDYKPSNCFEPKVGLNKTKSPNKFINKVAQTKGIPEVQDRKNTFKKVTTNINEDTTTHQNKVDQTTTKETEVQYQKTTLLDMKVTTNLNEEASTTQSYIGDGPKTTKLEEVPEEVSESEVENTTNEKATTTDHVVEAVTDNLYHNNKEE